MKKIESALFILACAIGLLSDSHAQQNGYYSPRSDAFAFDTHGSITSWDGSDPSNPPYPYDMGAVCLHTQCGGGYGSGIEIPFELGYLNNGFLSPCDPITFSAPTWTVGDGTHNGDTYTVSGSTTCPYFTGEYGSYGNSNNIIDGFSVTATYVRTFRIVCARFGCHKQSTDTLTGGNGTAQQTEINQ